MTSFLDRYYRTITWTLAMGYVAWVVFLMEHR